LSVDPQKAASGFDELLKIGYATARIEEKHKKASALVIQRRLEALKSNKTPDAFVVITPGCVVVKSFDEVHAMFQENGEYERFERILKNQASHERFEKLFEQNGFIDIGVAKIKPLEKLTTSDIAEADEWAISEGAAYVDENAMDDGIGVSISAPTIAELRPRTRRVRSKKMISEEIKQKYIDKDLMNVKYVALDSKTGEWRALKAKEAADLLNVESGSIARSLKDTSIKASIPTREDQNVELVFATKVLATPAMVFNALETFLQERNRAPIGDIPPEEVETGEFTEVGDGADDVANLQDLEDHLRTPNNDDINENLQPTFSQEAGGDVGGGGDY